MLFGWRAQLFGVHLADLLMHCLQECELQALCAFLLFVRESKRMHPNILPISFSAPVEGIYSARSPLERCVLSSSNHKLTTLATPAFLLPANQEQQTPVTATRHHPPPTTTASVCFTLTLTLKLETMKSQVINQGCDPIPILIDIPLAIPRK